MTQSGTRGRGRPRDPETDARITRAAAELILERGFDKMTVDEVAMRAGVGKATVYRRWPSKSDLAVAAIENILNVEFPEPDTGSVISDLRIGFTNAIAFANSPGGAHFMKMCIGESIRDPRIADLYRISAERREVQSREAFAKAIARGEVRPDVKIEYALDWIGGLIAGRIISNRPMPAPEEIDDMLQFVLRGILADPTSPAPDAPA